MGVHTNLGMPHTVSIWLLQTGFSLPGSLFWHCRSENLHSHNKFLCPTLVWLNISLYINKTISQCEHTKTAQSPWLSQTLPVPPKPASAFARGSQLSDFVFDIAQLLISPLKQLYLTAQLHAHWFKRLVKWMKVGVVYIHTNNCLCCLSYTCNDFLENSFVTQRTTHTHSHEVMAL